MSITFVGKHFIGNKEQLGDLVEFIPKLKTAKAISLEQGLEIDFGLKLTVAEDKLDPNLKTEIKEQLKQLPNGLWLLYDPVDRGPGTSYQQILFNPTFYVNRPGVVISGDSDQFVIDTSESLENLQRLVQEMESTQALYGVGARSIPVVLAAHARNSDLRIIHELFLSLTLGKAGVGLPAQGEVTPAYAEIGDNFSGLYVLNLAHPKYPYLLNDVTQAGRTANMCGFATDYYVAMKAAQLAPIVRQYVFSRANKCSNKDAESVELDRVKRLILSQTAELGKTDVRKPLVAALQSEDNLKLLAGFYPATDVSFVRELMLQSLGG